MFYWGGLKNGTQSVVTSLAEELLPFVTSQVVHIQKSTALVLWKVNQARDHRKCFLFLYMQVTNRLATYVITGIYCLTEFSVKLDLEQEILTLKLWQQQFLVTERELRVSQHGAAKPCWELLLFLKLIVRSFPPLPSFQLHKRTNEIEVNSVALKGATPLYACADNKAE